MTYFGFEAKAYYSIAPLTGTPDLATWVPLTIIKDLTLPDEMESADDTGRDNGGFTAQDLGLRTVAIEFEMKYLPTNAQFLALESAYMSRDEIAIAVMDGDEGTIGSKGVAGNFKVAKFERPEPLAAKKTVNVALAPSSLIADYEVTA